MVAERVGVDEASVRGVLATIADPEIPTISIVDLGIVRTVDVTPDAIRVELLPTFVGCPALDLIRSTVVDALSDFGRCVDVTFTFAEPWTTARITAAGEEGLASAGIAPPGRGAGRDLLVLDTPVQCPYCSSRRTVLENAFGPTQCRSIRYCTECRQPFEAFKAV